MEVGTVIGGQKFFGALFFSLVNVMFNGMAELAMTVFRLPVFYKQRDFLFFPAWAFGLPIWVLRIPLSLMESGIWIILTYYTIGFAPSASRFFRQFLAFFGIHQMALALFRFLAAVGRTQVVANTLGTFTLLLVFVLGGFIVAKGKVLLKARSFFTEDYWFWICIGALFGFSLLFNVLFIAALTFLNPLGDSKAVTVSDDEKKKKKSSPGRQRAGIDMATRNSAEIGGAVDNSTTRGMVLPFQPLSLAFNHVNYYVDMPAVALKVHCMLLAKSLNSGTHEGS
ncbi:PLEIOTROPIC DRUG RESISTANCE PROTEIN 1-LIKE ISOFORM X1 [Salix purpurea]|uniref:PLEIOTROPIC DRUG RESISTANCE PROTEIN 1-LIKE ISOFORM X1 n=1 Tax=Salix purpurea TaxID=77065 RepID=A0A9Q0T385_SALPP|nr:PLEIOTROPIC DRUG RESISTANCE PROTEIN 1-LIKE ISOFORM X1 [Salix purpurea]